MINIFLRRKGRHSFRIRQINLVLIMTHGLQRLRQRLRDSSQLVIHNLTFSGTCSKS